MAILFYQLWKNITGKKKKKKQEKRDNVKL